MKRRIYYLMPLSHFLCPNRLPSWPTFWNQHCGAWKELGRRMLKLAQQILFSVQARAKTVNILILISVLITNIHMYIHAKLISFLIGSNSPKTLNSFSVWHYYPQKNILTCATSSIVVIRLRTVRKYLFVNYLDFFFFKKKAKHNSLPFFKAMFLKSLQYISYN